MTDSPPLNCDDEQDCIDKINLDDDYEGNNDSIQIGNPANADDENLVEEVSTVNGSKALQNAIEFLRQYQFHRRKIKAHPR